MLNHMFSTGCTVCSSRANNVVHMSPKGRCWGTREPCISGRDRLSGSGNAVPLHRHLFARIIVYEFASICIANQYCINSIFSYCLS
jgi:hypothetical protein